MSGSSAEAHVETLRGQIQGVQAELEALVEAPQVVNGGEALERGRARALGRGAAPPAPARSYRLGHRDPPGAVSRSAQRRERDCFIRNRHRMAYERMAQLKLPLGSGAMESAIRRVVNLRLKGAGIFWHEAGAEAMLPLRAYYQAGRWNFLKKLTFSTPCLELA